MRTEPGHPHAVGPAEAVAAVVRAAADAGDPAAALRAGLRTVLEILGADAAAVSRGEEFIAAEGWGDGPPTGQLLADAAHAVPLGDGKLLVSRPGVPLTEAETALLAAMGEALGSAARLLRDVAAERAAATAPSRSRAT